MGSSVVGTSVVGASVVGVSVVGASVVGAPVVGALVSGSCVDGLHGAIAISEHPQISSCGPTPAPHNSPSHPQLLPSNTYVP